MDLLHNASMLRRHSPSSELLWGVCLKKLCSATGKSESNQLAFPHPNISDSRGALLCLFSKNPNSN